MMHGWMDGRTDGNLMVGNLMVETGHAADGGLMAQSLGPDTTVGTGGYG